MTRGLFYVLAGWGAIAVLVRPFTPVPFVDDWVYAWSVESLLDRGRLEVLDFSANAIYAQALWGAMFCIPFGFSFTALRLSTWVLATIALLGIYRLLREAGATEAGASLGAATLAAYPPFLILSFSFMTDVPMLAVETWMLVFFARVWRSNSWASLWAGTALACGAAAIRGPHPRSRRRRRGEARSAAARAHRLRSLRAGRRGPRPKARTPPASAGPGRRRGAACGRTRGDRVHAGG